MDPLGFGNGPSFRCEVCGYYIGAVPFLSSAVLTESIRPALSAATRKVYVQTPDEPVMLTLENYEQLAAAHRSTVSEKLEQLLQLLADPCGYPGGFVRLDPELDYPLIESRSPAEMNAYLSHLERTGLLNRCVLGGQIDCALLIPGWQRLEPLRKVGGIPGTCFVAMWFDPDMSAAYDLGILPAVEVDCGFKAFRVDRKEQSVADSAAKVRGFGSQFWAE